MSARLFKFIMALALVISLPLTARSEEVTIPYKGLNLIGELEMADGKTFKDGVIVITHGTMAHNKMEIITTVQGLLKERGLNTLAINLSLGLDNRRGQYDCAVTHRHKHSNAFTEMALWVKWLRKQGAGKIVLAGHSRGGNQTAQYMADKKVPKVLGAVLISPATWDKDREAETYKKNYKVTLNSVLGKMNRAVVTKKGDTVFKDIDFIYCPKTSVTAATFADYYAEDVYLDTPTVLVRVKKPVLVVAASEDTVVTDLPEKMVGVVNNHIKFTVIDGADHFFLDFYAEDLADVITEFVEKLYQ